jgi:hypothetical protein
MTADHGHEARILHRYLAALAHVVLFNDRFHKLGLFKQGLKGSY